MLQNSQKGGDKMPSIAIIGGGASGLAAAITAAEMGADVHP